RGNQLPHLILVVHVILQRNSTIGFLKVAVPAFTNLLLPPSPVQLIDVVMDMGWKQANVGWIVHVNALSVNAKVAGVQATGENLVVPVTANFIEMVGMPTR